MIMFKFSTPYGIDKFLHLRKRDTVRKHGARKQIRQKYIHDMYDISTRTTYYIVATTHYTIHWKVFKTILRNVEAYTQIQLLTYKHITGLLQFGNLWHFQYNTNLQHILWLLLTIIFIIMYTWMANNRPIIVKFDLYLFC